MCRLAAVALLVATAACTSDGMARVDPDSPPEAAIVVLAAASLTDVVEGLAEEYAAEHPGIRVELSTAGSSTLAEQIIEGAPADLYLAADDVTMARAQSSGRLGDAVPLAANRLVLVTPAGNPAGVESVRDLERDELAVGLCAPEVPCGRSAVEVLDRERVEAAPDTFEPDVRSLLEKLRLGELDAGLVYRTDVLASGGEVVEIPSDDPVGATRVYGAVVLDQSRPEVSAARGFLDLLAGPAGRAAFSDAGFLAP
jgi:molybdate transport system substrate-binding protein